MRRGPLSRSSCRVPSAKITHRWNGWGVMLASRIGFTAFRWRMVTYSIIKMNYDARREADDEETVNMVCQTLCRVDPNVFGKLFVETDAVQNMSPEMRRRAQEVYEKHFREYAISKPFEELMENWKTFQAKTKCKTESDLADRSSDCGSRVFNPVTNKYNAVFLSPTKKKQTHSEFETLKFLLRMKSTDEAIPLRWEADAGDYINNLYFDDEKEKKYLLADQSLRKIAKIVHVLNENSYRMMDLHPERMIK